MKAIDLIRKMCDSPSADCGFFENDEKSTIETTFGIEYEITKGELKSGKKYYYDFSGNESETDIILTNKNYKSDKIYLIEIE